MKLSQNKGFTLVEIMIVVAIIGIIIAIAVPAFLRARENARGQACQENLTKIDGAKEQYALEFRVGNGGAVTFADLVTPGNANQGEGYLRAEPNCPAGGTYTTNAIGAPPTCSYVAPAWAIQHVLPQ
jgi:prepilin-type N-terminal cleavage/methylation domain-containing protein